VVKFLTGTSYDGEKIPVCAYWSTTQETNPDESFTPLISQDTSGRCIANHYFSPLDISCFNDGRCNGEGKCLPCTKYRYGEGARMGISHSPPMDFFREFSKGFSDEDLRSPQIRAGGLAVTGIDQTQLPFHIIIRNIQAEIAKCCRWSEGNGSSTQFLLTTIIDGPDTIELTDADGKVTTVKGIRIKNDVFPDDVGNPDTNPEGGSFFPVGTVVVAGWSDAPSFYLEPRTGLVTPGEGVVFKSTENSETVNAQAKIIANGVGAALTRALDAINYCGFQAQQNANAEADYFNNIRTSSATAEQKQEAFDRTVAAGEAVNVIATAKVDATAASVIAFDEAQDLIVATTQDAVNSSAAACADALDDVADQLDVANVNCGGEPAAETAAGQSRQIRALSQSLRFAGRGGSTKCNLAFTDGNPAQAWNSPIDGSLPCNGMRSDCKFYTGPTWEFATTDKLEIGQKVTAEAIQELRYFSDDWTRYSDPEEEFRERFTTSFIWALKDFVDAGGVPDVADMILYRPKTMFAREPTNEEAPPDNPDTLDEENWETMLVEKVSISNFESLAFEKATSRIQPGSETLDLDRSTTYASKIGSFDVPANTRLRIAHPPNNLNAPFVYRAWTPEFTNRISLFGSASPEQVIYIVNDTALRERARYHEFYDSKDLFEIAVGLPGAASDFNGIAPEQLLQIFINLESEKATNQSAAVLGFDKVSSSRTGFWDSINQVDLVHNEINKIFVFIFTGPGTFIFDSVEVDYRVLHAVVGQDSFTSRDFTINDLGTNDTKLGIAIRNQVANARIVASMHQVLGEEPVFIDHGYYAWRFKDRNLRFSTLNAGSDLVPEDSVSGDNTAFVTESDASAFITNVSYRVVQYRAEETIDNWYLINDCGIIMAEIADPEVNRVMPLPNQRGEFQALSPVLVNNGATGSIVAPWAPESVVLNIGGEDKDMVLLYRNEDGVGLPANYGIYGPAPGDENLFGRPDPSQDTLTITYTYLRSQTHKKEGAGEVATEPEGAGEVVSNNFYGDRLRTHNHDVTFSDTGLVAGGNRPVAITQDQQDYVFVFKDSTDRPIGKKNVRFLVTYYNLACINVEIFYAWSSTCSTYGLIPDLFLATGGSNGRKESDLRATIDSSDLTLGHRAKNLVGSGPCTNIPNCGDHEVLRLAKTRKEFEVVGNIGGSDPGDPVSQKAFYPSAGQSLAGVDIAFTHPPESVWQLKRGTLWYPYITCEKPRYNKTMMGKAQTDTTELINITTSNSGATSGEFGAGTFSAGAGVQGPLAEQSSETHHAYDEVTARILDIHPTLRACLSGYTYGNTVLVGGASFSGYARKRGEVDTFWFDVMGWAFPPFGNFGRNMLMCEVATKRGDYSPSPESVAFRWMPVFPEREDMGAGAGLFGESLEPATLRLVATSCPLGGLSEDTPNESSDRYTHTSLITNRPAGGIDYPYVPYYPTFLPDALLGIEPEAQGIAPGAPVPVGAITTSWAWREQDKPIKRAQSGSDALIGMSFLPPDYFLDNRRMEVRLRPAEGEYVVAYTAPSYNKDGTISQNAEMRLGTGPPREILIDFINRQFGPALMPGTVYDTSQVLGDDALPCESRASSNLQLANLCSCEGNKDDTSGNELPAIFIHGDSLAPGDFVALYVSDEMGPAFPTDITRTDLSDPCCMCNYFLEQIHFRLSSTFLPLTINVDPALTTFTDIEYTWSRVPHGIGSNLAIDGIFSGQENRAQDYIALKSNGGGVLRRRPQTGAVRLDRTLVTAFWPSPTEAAKVLSDNSIGILVPGPLKDDDPKLLGGVPVSEDKESQGQSETITLDWTFDTFVAVKSVTVHFLAGKGMEVPKFFLYGIPTAARTGDFVTTRSGRLLGQSETVSIDTSVPGSFNSADIQAGEVLFSITIVPNLTDVVFWDKFYQEFHLVFGRRSNTLSMGIHSIQFTSDILTSNTSLTETIFIPERRYYTNSFSPPGKNPEENLAGMDSCTAYWRSTSTAPDRGGNRHRAYAWSAKITNESSTGQGGGQPTIGGDVTTLENLQAAEYGKARNLMSSPYRFDFVSFTPLDEQRWLTFLGGSLPSWTTTVSVTVNNIEDVTTYETDVSLYGEVPSRSVFHPPGHAWLHDLNENYNECCDGCGHSQLVEYKYAHLHDDLDPIETTGFWSDFSSGQGGASSVLPSAQATPDVRQMRERELFDQNGDPISAEVLNASGMRRDKAGNLILTGYTSDTLLT